MAYKYTQQQYIKFLKKNNIDLKMSILKEIDRRMNDKQDDGLSKSEFYENRGFMNALHWAYDQIK